MLLRPSLGLLQQKSVVETCVRFYPIYNRAYETTTKAKILPITHELYDIIKWKRPEVLPFWDPQKSGDLEPLPEIDPNWIRLKYQPFEEIIAKLPKEHQKLFTVNFGARRDGVQVIQDQAFKKVRRHKYDGVVERSYEHKVAWFTVKIRDLRVIIESSPVHKNNGIFRKQAKEFVEKRNKTLNHLRHRDYKRFEWLIEVMGVLFRPQVFQLERIYRKESVTKLTDILCNKIIGQKMQKYKEELEEQKIPFLEEKLNILIEIEADEKAMKLSSSVGEEISKTRSLLDKLKCSYDELKPSEEETARNENIFS